MSEATKKLPGIVWIFDSGAERLFPVSLYSLSRAAISIYKQAPLTVIDCGISKDLRAWLQSIQRERPNLTLVPYSLLRSHRILGPTPSRAASVMRLRMELPMVLMELMGDGRIPQFDTFLQLDTDTAFLSDPSEILFSNWGGENIRCCYEWDWIGKPENDHQEFMKFIRPSTFASADYTDKLPNLAKAFGLSVGELMCIPTVNSGVWMSSVGNCLTEKWVASYERLIQIDELIGPGLFNSYSSEQNALSIAIYRGEIIARFIPRVMNNLPPRDPYDWPSNLIIAHFVTFSKNRHRKSYRLWFQLRNDALAAEYVPPSLLNHM